MATLGQSPLHATKPLPGPFKKKAGLELALKDDTSQAPALDSTTTDATRHLRARGELDLPRPARAPAPVVSGRPQPPSPSSPPYASACTPRQAQDEPETSSTDADSSDAANDPVQRRQHATWANNASSTSDADACDAAEPRSAASANSAHARARARCDSSVSAVINSWLNRSRCSPAYRARASVGRTSRRTSTSRSSGAARRAASSTPASTPSCRAQPRPARTLHASTARPARHICDTV